MKNILCCLATIAGTAVSFSLPATALGSSAHAENGVFRDEESGIILRLPPNFTFLEKESDLKKEEEERWMIFSDGSENDIALIIYRLDRVLSVENFFFDYLLKEFEGELPENIRLLFGRPSLQRFSKSGHVIAKIQYPIVSVDFDYLNAEYFFTHGNYGFNIWISPEQNKQEDLHNLGSQIEQMLDSLEFMRGT